ncbi:MAG TPA: N-acetyl-alpha-D-glucosaminyl L-malate synthase BshA [Planctomycetota bacterium]|nr:N-acetyl-alpha-D-glucosaminyl L-malate synthase BshA [Planctomycetota bacterium]
MKLGILCYPTSGGSGVVATELGAALAARGHEVHVVSYRKPFRAVGPASDRFHFHKVELPVYPLFEYPSYGLAAAALMARVADEAGLDVLHVHYAYPHAVSAYLARRMSRRRGLKIVTTLHGTDIMLVREDESFASLTRFGILESDAVTAVSAFLRDTTRTWFDIRKRIDVIPNFVDALRFKPAGARAPGPFRIVHVSNFRPVKRPLDAVKAFCILRKSHEAKLRMIGVGPEQRTARALARKLGVLADIEFTGEERQVERLLAESDALLSTSEFEGFGLAPLEAMAAGLPVVATKAGGISEVVKDGVTGRLADVGDVEGLAGLLGDLIDNPLLARRQGEAGRKRAAREFGLERVVPLYEAVYQRLARKEAVSRA